METAIQLIPQVEKAKQILATFFDNAGNDYYVEASKSDLLRFLKSTAAHKDNKHRVFDMDVQGDTIYLH